MFKIRNKYHFAKKKSLYIKVLTTSKCNLRCPECNQREWKNDVYNLTISNINYFFNISEQSDYIFDTISLGSREPTMNPLLPDIIRTIKNRGVSKIRLVTNGYKIDLLEPVKELIDSIHFSYYGKKNINALIRAQKIFGEKINLVAKKEHYIIRNEPSAEMKPIKCLCPGITLYGDKLYSCTPVKNLQMRFPDLEPKDSICTDVSPYFLKKLYKAAIKGTKYCYYCSDNENVRITLKKSPLF